MGFADLTGRIAVVTGGAGGLGAGISRVLAGRGAKVVVADSRLEAAKDLSVSLGAQFGDEVFFPFEVDIAESNQVRHMVATVLEALGRIDILVNNAGVHSAAGMAGSGAGFREEDWEATFRVNVRGTVLVTEAVAPGMIDRGNGKIINISSHAGRGELPSGSGVPAAGSGGAYGASKAAVIHLTQTYANRLGPYNINVNCVCPGSIFTPLWAEHARWAARNNPSYQGLSPEEVYEKSMRERCPLGRGQTPDDVGNAVAFFASDEAMNITGQSLNVNGGQRMN